jgi:hypothetical protein
MSIEQLAELTGDGRDSAYEKVRAGVFPSLRLGSRGKYAVLTAPTLEILRGQREPGRPVDRPEGGAEKRRRTTRSKAKAKKKRPAKQKPVVPKGEVAPAAAP